MAFDIKKHKICQKWIVSKMYLIDIQYIVEYEILKSCL